MCLFISMESVETHHAPISICISGFFFFKFKKKNHVVALYLKVDMGSTSNSTVGIRRRGPDLRRRSTSCDHSSFGSGRGGDCWLRQAFDRFDCYEIETFGESRG